MLPQVIVTRFPKQNYQSIDLSKGSRSDKKLTSFSLLTQDRIQSRNKTNFYDVYSNSFNNLKVKSIEKSKNNRNTFSSFIMPPKKKLSPIDRIIEDVVSDV